MLRSVLGSDLVAAAIAPLRAICVLTVGFFLAAVRVWATLLSVGHWLWSKVPGMSRAPLVGVLGAYGAFAAIALPEAWGGPAWSLAPAHRICAVIVILGIYFCSALAYLEFPIELSSLERVVERRPLERWLSKGLRRGIDAIFATLVWRVSVLAVPPFVLLAWPGGFSVESALFFLTTVMVSGPTLETIDHTDIHNHVFTPAASATRLQRTLLRTLELFHTYVLCQILLRMPLWYRCQHVSLHHADNNTLADHQSSLRYDSTSFTDFSWCAAKMTLSTQLPVDVFLQLRERKKYKQSRELVWGAAVAYASLALLAWLSLPAFVCQMGMRLIGGTLSAIGFFRWHGLVDASATDNSFKNSLNIAIPKVDTDTHYDFGGRLHIEHHDKPGRHWSDLARDARANLARYDEEQSLLITLKGSQGFVGLLWRRDFEAIAVEVAPLGVGRQPPPELQAVLRARARLDLNRKEGSIAHSLDRTVSRAMSRVVWF
jgi:hypothetical protein